MFILYWDSPVKISYFRVNYRPVILYTDNDALNIQHFVCCKIAPLSIWLGTLVIIVAWTVSFIKWHWNLTCLISINFADPLSIRCAVNYTVWKCQNAVFRYLISLQLFQFIVSRCCYYFWSECTDPVYYILF